VKTRALFLFLSACTAAAPARRSPAQESRAPRTVRAVVQVEGRAIAYETAGAGGPTVVLESGLGDSREPWDGLFLDLARFTRVVRYDRAGYGASQERQATPSLVALASDLHGMLAAAGIRPPYVLVGHSLGGAIIRAYAARYPGEVAGLVFVDPLTENMFARLSPDQMKSVIAEQDRATEQSPPGTRKEWATMKAEVIAGFPELRSFGRPPDVPVALLIAGKNRPPGWVAAVFEQYGPWVTGAGEGRLYYTSESTHYVQVDEPAAIVEAVRRVMFPSLEKRLARALDTGGAAAAVSLFRQVAPRYPQEYLNERILNQLGYRQLAAHKVADAIALFRLNVERYPRSANVYDSLGEAYMVAGERERAIANYRKSLALDPKNRNAVAMLEKLGARP